VAVRIDPTVIREMRAFGAFDVSACFNCGNCTAVCPLSEAHVAFPRRVIRYAQLGQREHIAASKEVWLCYYCAECSDTCPRQAEPGEFMASARRYAIATFDPTSIARRLYRSKSFNLGLLTVVFAAILGILLATSPGLPSGAATSGTLLQYIPFESIHWLGIGVMIVVVALVAATLGNMLWMLSRAPTPGGLGATQVRPERFPLVAGLAAGWAALAEVVGQKRYRDCDAERAVALPPWPLRRWVVHFSIMGGIVGLAAATVLDYLLKTPGSYVPVYSPIRLLGTVAGALFMYGTTAIIVQRLRRQDKYHSHTLLSDWIFLALLWVIGASGFVLEVADYIQIGRAWVAVVFLIHMALAFELILLLPFTKLAHVVYRPVAIWFTEFRRLRATNP
jgi:ferredoxin